MVHIKLPDANVVGEIKVKLFGEVISPNDKSEVLAPEVGDLNFVLTGEVKFNHVTESRVSLEKFCDGHERFA